MADIKEIREAIDQHLALHVASLAAKSDADTIDIATREAIDKANAAFETSTVKAQKTMTTAVETAERKRGNLVTVEQEKMGTAQAAVVDAEQASIDYRFKVKEDLNIELPVYGKSSSGGHTRL